MSTTDEPRTPTGEDQADTGLRTELQPAPEPARCERCDALEAEVDRLRAALIDVAAAASTSVADSRQAVGGSPASRLGARLRLVRGGAS